MTGRRRLTGLRMRLAAAFTAVALLASVLASGISYVLMRRVMLQRAQDAVLTDVRTSLAQQVPQRLPPDAQDTLGADLAIALEAEGRRAAWVQVPLDGSVPRPGPDVLDVPVSEEFARRAMRGMVFQRVVRKDRANRGHPYLLIGTRVTGYETTADEPWRTTPPMVFVSASLAREEADLRSFTRVLSVADVLALAAALLLALLATRGVLRPVRRLAAAAG
ncbi:hypothetical protein G3I70_04000, partial [Actinomadura bangladeshensis]|nr:hypothetical protein [Actinomadura bangladeshensis]